jgi:hypothetical protein
LYTSPLSGASLLSEEREGYYNYFEDTYIGMMATISQQNSDNLSSVDKMNQSR